MADSETKRVRRTPEERAAQERIKVLEGKKQEILAPKPPRKPRKTKKQKIQEILKEAQKNGMKPEEIAEKLGINLSE